MNILHKIIPSLRPEQEEALDADTQAAEEKADRIKFHRAKVRNGPVKFATLTNGQVRRAQKRAAKREVDRNFRLQKRSYFASQREAAVLRIHLQRVGVLPFATPEFFAEQDPRKIENSIVWILEHFPTDGDGLVNALEISLQQAYDRFAFIVGLPPQKIELNPALVS